MKQPKKLTRDLKMVAGAYGLVPDEWMLLKDGDVYVTLIHKTSVKMEMCLK